eukprot:TRINITY_DN13952_c0_g1_i1.p1 TRINITY_DN13952_c0_g1~~TRINITY_DN13952_c0_g1_i1.p1  ORF type:complete len:197 (+),score=61.34 TRINITY_DN13952_c0_g1_i1:11-601(+)
MIRRPPRSTQSRSSAASDVYKRQTQSTWGISKLRTVMRLQVHFLAWANMGVTNKTMKELSKMLASLPNLEQLELNLLFNKNVNDEGATVLGEQLSHLSQLTALNLNLGSTEVCDEGVACIAKSLKPLRNLKSLGFHLSGCLRLTDVGASEIADLLEVNSSIEEAMITFSYSGVTKVGKSKIRGMESKRRFLRFETK